jgi:hypothetical protein
MKAKRKTTYSDATVGRVQIARATAAKVIRGWRAAGHKVSYKGPPGRRFAFYRVTFKQFCLDDDGPVDYACNIERG